MLTCLAVSSALLASQNQFAIQEASAIPSELPAIPQEKSKKLILHFDINRTILMEDMDRTFDESIIYSLAYYYKDRWDERVSEPIYYGDYVKQYLVPGQASDKAIKAERYKRIKKFIEFLKETNHPLLEEIESKYRAAAEKGSKSLITPAFYRLLDYLNEKGIEYSIVLRTFGNDTDRVMEEINRKLDTPFFKGKGKVIGENVHLDRVYEDVESIYSLYKGHLDEKIHFGLEENWELWADNKEARIYGKKFPFEANGDILSLFFDDNIETDENRNVVNPVDAKTGAPLSVKELLADGYIVRVDGVQALIDDNYFIDKVEKALNSNAKCKVQSAKLINKV